MKLSRKLTLSFIFSIIIAILIISFISNFMINNRFENYLLKEQENKLQQISIDINNLYNENGHKLYQREINSYASIANISIEIKDLNDNTIYSSTGNTSMGGMHKKMMRMHNISQGNYVKKSFPLLEDSTEVAKLIIGYIDNAYLTDRAIVFKNTLTKSLFISAIITIFLGIVTSIVLSRSLTTPLLDIRNTALDIQRGNLETRSVVNTNTTEIVDLSNSINYLGETLANQENIRKRYASDISHELRTPLSTLKSHLEAILDGIWDPSKEHLNILMVEIDRLSSLVDDLKNSFRSEEFELILNKTKFNLSQELDDIITTFIPLYNKENFKIESNIDHDIYIMMDKDKLKQVMYNLLSNSLKYLDKEGKVLVTLKKEEKDIIIKVADNGIGIKDKDLPYIFNRFYRSDISRNNSTGGTGLGLAIVKSIVEAHGGTIKLESEYSEGTIVTMILPIKI